jgi:hypothetical protein
MRADNAQLVAMLRNRAVAGSGDAADLFAVLRFDLDPADAALLGHFGPS